MAVGIFLVIASIAGMINGILRKNLLLTAGSIIGLIGVICVWIYFYNNPY